MSDVWSDQQKQQFKTLWETTILSAREIGIRLGVSKNAVVGMRKRMKLEPRPCPIGVRSLNPKRRGPQSIKPAKAKKAAAAAPPAPAPAPAPAITSIAAPPPVAPAQPAAFVRPPTAPVLGLVRECQYPIGDPAQRDTFRFCGEPPVIGKPYCRDHCAVTYVTAPRA